MPDLATKAAEVEQLAVQLRRSFFEGMTGRDLKVSILSSFMVEYLNDTLRLFLARRGVKANIRACGYGQMMQEVLTNGSTLAGNPDVVLLLPSHGDLRFAPAIGVGAEEARRAVEDEVAFWLDLIGRIRAPSIFLSFAPPRARILGEGDGFVPGGLGRHIRAVNLALADQLGPMVTLVDGETLDRRLGRYSSDSRLYALCKQPFAMEALPEVADTLAAAIIGAKGWGRKALILDLDNTLWGGVVGDVGVEGLELGPETAEGEAFVSFQTYVRDLSRRGVILAICSKNNEAIAKEAFRKHPAMVLTEADISCFVANFDDKASNIRSIAQTLNIGLDAIVFVDDNPVERAWVHSELPEVFVVDLPEDPALYVDAVEEAKMFPHYHTSKEDLNRTKSYKLNAVVKKAAIEAGGIEDFLRNLEPQAFVERVGAGSIGRVVQLIGKTNQFKLNPAQFSAEEIRQAAGRILALRLVDKMQDYGIVAVAVTEQENGALWVRNWVMSCRVFNRRLEHATRELLAAMAEEAGVDRIKMRYVASAKNSLVPPALESLGFIDSRKDGLYEGRPFPPDGLPPHYMRIRDMRLQGELSPAGPAG